MPPPPFSSAAGGGSFRRPDPNASQRWRVLTGASLKQAERSLMVLVSRRGPEKRAADALAAAAPPPEYSVTGSYLGAWLDDKRHGVGTATYANGDRYEGGWAFGERSGRGTLFIMRDVAGAQRLVKEYDGEWSRGMRHGWGAAYALNGEIFEGSFVEGVRSGRGSLTYPSGDRYDGSFVGGVCSGRGMLSLANGDAYEGSWEGGLRHGHGRHCFVSKGRVLVGEWVRGVACAGEVLSAEDVAASSNTDPLAPILKAAVEVARGTAPVTPHATASAAASAAAGIAPLPPLALLDARSVISRGAAAVRSRDAATPPSRDLPRGMGWVGGGVVGGVLGAGTRAGAGVAGAGAVAAARRRGGGDDEDGVGGLIAPTVGWGDGDLISRASDSRGASGALFPSRTTTAGSGSTFGLGLAGGKGVYEGSEGGSEGGFPPSVADPALAALGLSAGELAQLSTAFSSACVAGGQEGGEDALLPPTPAALDVALDFLGIRGSPEDLAAVLSQLLHAQARWEEEGLARGGGGICFSAFASVLCQMRDDDAPPAESDAPLNER